MLLELFRGMRRGLRRNRVGCSVSSLGFENLEQRQMLSGTPPTVVDVSMSSTEWSTAFVDYLEANTLGLGGYSIPTGSAVQTKPLPWENLDQIKITFSEDVHVQAADLALSGVNTTHYEVDSFFYDAYNHVATWTFSSAFAPERFLIDLDADGLDPVRDLDDNILDGDWTDNSSSGASGNGTAGGDFEFSFTILPGDVDQNQAVIYADYMFVRAREGQDTSGQNYTALHDIDGSGLIDTTDWMHVLGHLWTTPPAGQPAGISNDAPTTAGISSISLDNPAVDIAISLFNAFDDAEDYDNQLSYLVVGNSNPSVLDELSFNTTTGELTVSAAENMSGRATLTVSATDSQGLSVTTTFAVDVDYENQPPVIVDFLVQELPANTWLITGYVQDSDDDVAGFIVELGGVYETRYTVNEIGYFELAVILDEEEWGYEWAHTEDPHGLGSNTPIRFIGLT